MSDLQGIADRVEIEALRGEFTNAAGWRSIGNNAGESGLACMKMCCQG